LDLLVSTLYMYKVDNAVFEVYDVNTNMPTAQPFRGVPLPAYHFGVEQLVDQIAEKAGIDPIEVRLKNTYRTGDTMPPYGAKLSNFAIEECADEMVEASMFKDKWQGWDKPVQVSDSKRRGIGVAISMGWTDWQFHRSAAIVKIYPDGTAEVIVGAQDLGTGINTTVLQITAEELGLPVDKIKITTGNTELTPDDWGACGSRTLYCAGTAAKEAAKKAREALINAACSHLGAAKEEIELSNGEIRFKGKNVPFAEIIKEPISVTHKNEPPAEVAPLYYATYVGAAVFHVAEVEVDMETGEIQVLKYTAVQDVGRSINPLVVEGQVYGSVLQGLGFVLTEEMLFDKKSGKPLNPSFLDYKIYDFQDAPDIQTIAVESNEPTGPFGAIGVGEHCLNPVPGAVANAVYNAIGTRVLESPITPERVLKALGKI